jgi:two-component system, chemotaxis family, CheB/CheR fusion protein
MTTTTAELPAKTARLTTDAQAGSPSAAFDIARLAQPEFRMMIEAVPAAIYATDADGRITFYNNAAAELWGVRPEIGKSEFCGSWKLYWPDGTRLPHNECPMAMALRERRPVLGLEAVAERPDGTRVPFQPYPTPLFDNDGKLIGAVNMLVELTERKDAEHTAQRLAAIVESSDDAIIGIDLEGVITNWNRGAERLFGYAPREVVGNPVTMLLPEDRQDEEVGILTRIRRGERVEHYETRRRRCDGTILDISLTVSPIVDQVGRIVGASKIARDVTERHRLEETKTILLAEMKHRIKNNLATVQAFATMTMHSATKDEHIAFQARLHALGAAHDLITHQHWDRAVLRDVVTSALAPFRETEHSRIELNGPDVILDANKVLLLSLALHELATNAVKYGALANENGRITVDWGTLANGSIPIVWRESGGPPVAPPQRTGFGSRLIRHALAGGQGSVDFDYQPTGLVCSIQIFV